MTGPEAKEILRLVFGAYPTQRARMQPEDVRAMLEVWSLGLADVDYDVAKIAVGRIVCTSKWLPSIAELRSEIGIVHHGEKRNGLEAWGDVLKLYNFRSGTEGVDPLVLQVCGAFGWIEHRTLWRNGEDVDQWHVVHGENEASDRARFAELYNKLTADERKAAQLSAGAQIPRLREGQGARSLGDTIKAMLPSGSKS